jgi:hypothetical protein
MSNIVKGSLAAIAQQEGQSLAESFLSADLVVLVDTSGTMSARDVDGPPATDTFERYFGGGSSRSRFEAACDELATLQAQHPGKVAVVGFSSRAQFCWGGRPPFDGDGTDMAEALRFIRPADGTGMTIVLISDGLPNDADETLAVARTFASPIMTIYIGPAGERGEAFLRKLASLTGGQHSTNKVPELSAHIAGLLGSGKAAA